LGHDAAVQEPPVPKDEEQRLTELRSLGLLDTAPEERFDRITRMAQRLFDVPIALVSLVDEDRQWFKSRQGLEATETPRSVSFCAHALEGDEVLFVEDALRDGRFADNPLVTDDPNIRFYAGAPIAGPDGSVLGTLCVIDRQPRQLTPDDRRTLEDLAEMVEDEIAFTRLAIADELTGLSNRRGLSFLGRQVLAVCERQKTPAVLVFADLDDLKPINDQYGHDAGDSALVAVASALSSTFRRADVLARVGGDEFAALLAGTDAADEPMARLREELSRPVPPTDRPLSVSIGSAVFDPEQPVDLDDLVAAADAAMYEDKQRRKAAASAD
jgi:diguanylate cyclase (GGDEF)-like protein